MTNSLSVTQRPEWQALAAHYAQVQDLTLKDLFAQDSTRYAAVLREKKKAETQRDSVMHQLNIIKTIDNNRFVWPHVMDEISRAMPQYTWLTALEQTSAVTVVGSVDTTTKSKKKKAASTGPRTAGRKKRE